MTHEDCRAVLASIDDPRPKKFFLDTDTANEIDDQFAVAYALLADNVDVLGFGAAPFLNIHAVSPADGMEKSYEEFTDRFFPLRDTHNCERVFKAVMNC